MGTLPEDPAARAGGRRSCSCHGSPRKINEFLWESTTPAPFLREAAARTTTPTSWSARTPASTGAGGCRRARGVVNAGALGRPANDGRTNVWYAILTFGRDVGSSSRPSPTTTRRWRARWPRRSCPRSSSRPSAPAGGRPAWRSFRREGARARAGSRAPGRGAVSRDDGARRRLPGRTRRQRRYLEQPARWKPFRADAKKKLIWVAAGGGRRAGAFFLARRAAGRPSRSTARRTSSAATSRRR